MERLAQYTATPRHSQWRDLSDQHARVRERLRSSLTIFAEGRGAPVPSIVGAYGSGKSELMAWGFRYCWRTLGVPAFMLNAENLLRQLPKTMSPTQFSEEVGAFVQDQLALLDERLEADSLPDSLCLATDMRAAEGPLSYLRELFEDWALSADTVRSMLSSGRGVLFIDEIEQQYSQLLEQVEANDRAPLREMLQRLGSGQEPYYVVLSFGLTSAYEAIGGADARRMNTLTLPIPDPVELEQFTNLDGYGNFIWWASRGRPGWAVKLANDWGHDIASVQTLERFTDLQPRSIENLPLIDVSSLPVALHTQRVNELITQLLKSLRPVPWSDLQFSSERREEDKLPHNLVLIVHSEDELTPLTDLIDCFQRDLTDLAGKLQVSISDPAQLRRYLTRVYSALADEYGRVVFGGPRKTELLARGVIAPALILTQDLLLEFEGDQESTLGVLDLLDKVMNHVGIVGDQVRDVYDLVREFPEVEELFIETRELKEESWLSLSPKAVEAFFPRLVGRPLLTLLPGAKPTLDEQRAALEAAVKSGAKRMHATVQHEATTVEFIFTPTSNCLHTIQESDFNRNRRRHYLAADRIFVFLDLADENNLRFIREVNGDDIRVMEELQKLQTMPLPEKRLKDFLTSLWHNLLQADLDGEETISLKDALEIVRSEADLTKSDRRKLEYYEQRLNQTLDSIAVTSARKYQGERRRLFSPGQPQFPGTRIEEVLRGVKENRSIEQIGLAVDLTDDYDTTVKALTGLRQLKHLRKLTKPPSAYNEFLENYTVTIHPMEPGASLKEIHEFIRTQNGFDDFRDIAGRLGLHPPSAFESAAEATEEAPLLLLYNHLTSPKQAFIKALSFYAYVDNNRPEYVQFLDEVTDGIAKMQRRLEHLQEDVKNFNSELAYDLLDWAEIDEHRAEVDLLANILDDRDRFPPMLAYVVYRFADSAMAKLQEEEQRWASEHGLEGWRKKLRDLRDWRQNLDGLKEDVNSLFVQNQELKTDILGDPETILKKLQHQLEGGAGQVFDSLQTGNALDSADRLHIDVEIYTDARDEVRERLDKLRRQATDIDHLLDELDEIQFVVNRAIGKLGGAHGE